MIWYNFYINYIYIYICFPFCVFKEAFRLLSGRASREMSWWEATWECHGATVRWGAVFFACATGGWTEIKPLLTGTKTVKCLQRLLDHEIPRVWCRLPLGASNSTDLWRGLLINWVWESTKCTGVELCHWFGCNPVAIHLRVQTWGRQNPGPRDFSDLAEFWSKSERAKNGGSSGLGLRIVIVQYLQHSLGQQ